MTTDQTTGLRLVTDRICQCSQRGFKDAECFSLVKKHRTGEAALRCVGTQPGLQQMPHTTSSHIS